MGKRQENKKLEGYLSTSVSKSDFCLLLLFTIFILVPIFDNLKYQ